MDRVRGFEYAVVVGLVGAVVLTGPLVGAADLTHEQEVTGLGEGSITVASATIDGTVTLTRGDYGAGAYYLNTPPARLEVTAVTGRPIVVYSIDLPGLNYRRSTSHFLSGDDTGTQSLSIARDSMTNETVTNGSYAGRLQVVARTNGTDRLLYSENVTVEVDS